MTQKILLTGVKPTGSPHLGNYLGTIKPALELARNAEYKAYYFIADYHALSSIQDPKTFRELIYEVAATWLALGLDPDQSVFYRQGDIPEIFELSWILSCFTPKGLMNRAHAYKAAVAKNQETGTADVDAGIDMGLYCYPILMSADILAFNSNIVPVGKDQVQHVEIARDLAIKFNQIYGPVFTVPGYKINEATAVLPGLDGRKMSKSYGNTIPLFAEPKKLQKLINSIKTDSTPPEAPKDADSSYIFQIFRELASPEETARFRLRFEQGIGWGHAKAELFELLNSVLEKPRTTYTTLMNDKGELDRLLRQGKERARERTGEVLSQVRKAMGCPV